MIKPNVFKKTACRNIKGKIVDFIQSLSIPLEQLKKESSESNSTYHDERINSNTVQANTSLEQPLPKINTENHLRHKEVYRLNENNIR